MRAPTLEATVLAAWADKDKPFAALVPLASTDVNFVGFIRVDGDSMITLRLHNTSHVTARNVALRLQMTGLLGWRYSNGQDPGLRPAAGAGQVRELHWEGGADYAIHGQQTREIWVDLSEMRVLKHRPVRLDLEVFADGFHLKKSVPLELVAPEEYDERRSVEQGAILDELAREEAERE